MRYFMGTLLAAGLVFAGDGVSRATDVVRLGGPAAQQAISGGTNTELARGFHGGGFHGGGFRGGYGGYRGGYYGGYRGGYYGGYRGYYGGYGGYRGYYGGYGGYYRPYYYGSYYRPYYYGSYYSPYYYNSGYYSPYYYSSYYTPYYYPTYSYGVPYYYPCATTASPIVSIQPSTVYSQAPSYAAPYSQGPTYATPNAPAPRPVNPVMPSAPQDNGTFPYDGGPKNPLPMPMPNQANPMPNQGNAPNPMKAGPRPMIPLDGKLVSLPKDAIGGSSPVAHDVQRLHFVSVTNTSASPAARQAPARIAYPAYGEQSIPPAPRKIGTR